MSEGSLPRVIHFVTGGFSGATQVAIELARANLDACHFAPMLVLRRKHNTPMERVALCRSSSDDETGRNNCIIRALEGRANTDQEMRMLAATYQVTGRTRDAVRTMRAYIQRYPSGSAVPAFQRYIEHNSG
jgi:hypothetical protein